MSKNGIVFNDPSLAKQSYADEVDVNKLMERAAVTGQLSVSDVNGMYYGDASEIPDLFSALSAVARGEAAFMALNWETRERFHNSVGELYAFLSDPKNYDEGVKLGFFREKESVGVQDRGPEAPKNSAKAPADASAASKAGGAAL